MSPSDPARNMFDKSIHVNDSQQIPQDPKLKQAYGALQVKPDSTLSDINSSFLGLIKTTPFAKSTVLINAYLLIHEKRDMESSVIILDDAYKLLGVKDTSPEKHIYEALQKIEANKEQEITKIVDAYLLICGAKKKKSLWAKFEYTIEIITNFLYIIPDITLTVIAGIYAEQAAGLIWLVVLLAICRLLDRSTSVMKFFSVEKKSVWQENTSNLSLGATALFFIITCGVLGSSLSNYFTKSSSIVSLGTQMGLMQKMVLIFATALALWTVLDALTRANQTISYSSWLLRKWFVPKRRLYQKLKLTTVKDNQFNPVKLNADSKNIFIIASNEKQAQKTLKNGSQATQSSHQEQTPQIVRLAHAKQILSLEYNPKAKQDPLDGRYRYALSKDQKSSFASKGIIPAHILRGQKNNIVYACYLTSAQHAELLATQLHSGGGLTKTKITTTVYAELEDTKESEPSYYPVYYKEEKKKSSWLGSIAGGFQSVFDNIYWKMGTGLVTCGFDVVVTIYSGIWKWPTLYYLIIPCACFGFIETILYNFKFYCGDDDTVARTTKGSEKHKHSNSCMPTIIKWFFGLLSLISALSKFITKYFPTYAVSSAIGLPHHFCVALAVTIGVVCVLRNVINLRKSVIFFGKWLEEKWNKPETTQAEISSTLNPTASKVLVSPHSDIPALEVARKQLLIQLLNSDPSKPELLTPDCDDGLNSDEANTNPQKKMSEFIHEIEKMLNESKDEKSKHRSKSSAKTRQGFLYQQKKEINEILDTRAHNKGDSSLAKSKFNNIYKTWSKWTPAENTSSAHRTTAVLSN